MFLEVEPGVTVYRPGGEVDRHADPDNCSPPPSQLSTTSQGKRSEIEEAMDIAQVYLNSRTPSAELVKVAPDEDAPEPEGGHPRRSLRDLKALDLNTSLRNDIRAVDREPVKLSSEQMKVVRAVMSGKSIFFTGSAGTGKSVVLREIIKHLKEEWNDEFSVAVTASTGIAAVNIGGSTVHSWAGIGKGDKSAESLLQEILGTNRYEELKEYEANGVVYPPFYWNKVPKRMERWRECKVLILDEISMIDGRLFDKLEYLARRIRNKPAPFGGIQLVLCGDFLQLPPVPDRDEHDTRIPSLFAFEALSWDSCIKKVIVLQQVYRQKDPVFVNILNTLRTGHVDREAAEALRRLDRPIEYTDSIEPAELYPRRYEVDLVNGLRLGRIEGILWLYVAHDQAGYEVTGEKVTLKRMKRLLESVMAPEVLALKIGAQVMLVRNLIQGLLVNGSRGTVVNFQTTRDAVRDGAHLGYISKIPWPSDDMDKDEYDALEAAKQREYDKILDNPKPWPVVDFISFHDPTRSIRVCCYPVEFEIHTAYGGRRAVREQVPLIMSWAITMHKSQGQTLDRVKIDLKSVFESGQAYVALSRATNMDALEVRGFDPLKVTADYRVLHWMEYVIAEQDEDDDDMPMSQPPEDFWSDEDYIPLSIDTSHFEYPDGYYDYGDYDDADIHMMLPSLLVEA